MTPSRRKRALSARPETCPSCGAVISERYCAACGEMRASSRDTSLKDFLAHAFEAFTHADGRVLATLRALVSAPGRLASEYFAGRRKPYLAPLQLFLVTNLVFFVIESALHINVLSSTLAVQIHHTLYRRFARSLAESAAASKGVSLDELARGFDASAATLAKSLVIVMVPLFALFASLPGRGRGVVAHLVVALHFLTFFLLLTSAVVIATAPIAALFEARGTTLDEHALDTVLTLLMGAVLSIHLWHTLRRVHGHRGARLFGWTVWLVVGFVATLYVYRVLLFWLALNAQR